LSQSMPAVDPLPPFTVAAPPAPDAAEPEF
jgi:hypothetical protein